MVVRTKEDGKLYVRSKPGIKKKNPEEVRDIKVRLCLNKLEYDRLQKLTALKNATVPDYLRSLISKEFARI